jgi:hypothetical protein
MDYGEAFLLVPTRNGTSREDEHSATEAYSQAFRRACSKFGLGRYLYDLGKLRLPYDPEQKWLAITRVEHVAWVERLYRDAGLPLSSRVTAVQPAVSQADSTVVHSSPSSSPSPKVAICPAETHDTATTPSLSVRDSSLVSSDRPSGQPSSIMPMQPASYPDDLFLDWVAQQVARNPRRIQGICDFYQVTHLVHLNQQQRANLTQRLKRQQMQTVPSHSLEHTR